MDIYIYILRYCWFYLYVFIRHPIDRRYSINKTDVLERVKLKLLMCLRLHGKLKQKRDIAML